MRDDDDDIDGDNRRNADGAEDDTDGDGRRDLVRSVPDMLASTANFLKSKGGWRAGQPWGPGTANYNAQVEWNKAEVYQRTIGVMADKLSGR